MTSGDIAALIVAAALVLLAGLLVCAETAISAISRVRAEQLEDEGRPGARRLVRIASDPARLVNSAFLAGVACETTAVVLVTWALVRAMSSDAVAVAVAAVVMVIVSYVAVGVGPRTIGRQHAARVALAAGGPVSALAAVIGPFAQALIVIGNVATPGRGFREGPFASEAELRALVDQAEQSQVIEQSESRMIHSVFELGDTLVREVMVPRTDIVFIERHKTLRQLMSLALRSGFSRIPVVGEGLDDVIGIAYLKDVTKRVFDNRQAESTEHVDSVMRECAFVPDSKPADEVMRDMQALRNHVAIVVDEYGGTAGLVTIEDVLEEIVGEITDEYDDVPEEVEHVPGGVRVSSRMDLDEVGEIFGVAIDDDDVETVGGLMAKHLGRVPIPGSEVTCEGLRFRAESLAGRRNRVVTVLITSADAVQPAPHDDDAVTGTPAADSTAG